MPTLKDIARHATFLIVYFAAMTLLMAIALEIDGFLSGVEYPINSNVMARLPMNMTAVFVSFVLCGFLLVHLTVYCLLMHELPQAPRLLLSMLVFLVAFLFLVFMIAESFGIGEARLLLLGILAVAASDTLADLATRRWYRTVQPPQESPGGG